MFFGVTCSKYVNNSRGSKMKPMIIGLMKKKGKGEGPTRGKEETKKDFLQISREKSDPLSPL